MNDYFIRKFKKCKYCNKEAKRNIQSDGRNKGHYRTCGSEFCLRQQYLDEKVSKQKRFDGIKTCLKCKIVFKATNARQKWCSTCCPNATAKGRLQRYNISAPEFKIMFDAQNGLCFICKKKPARELDHCHNTNRVRKILCSRCNHIVGIIEGTDLQLMEEIKKYVTVC